MRPCRLALTALFALLALPAGAAPMKATEAPQGTDVTWKCVGPGGGGWIQSLAWDPRDPETLYVGCDVGGFYVSHDAGRHYELRNTGLRSYFVECLAVHPKESGTILLGTEGGIFRTTDEGKHWEWMRQGFPPVVRYAFSAAIGAVCFDPSAPDVAYAGVGRPRWGKDGHGAIYRSEDAGRTWRNVSEGQLPADAIVSDIEVLPSAAAGLSRLKPATTNGVVVAATNKGVFRSEDGGKAWKLSSQGLPHLYTEELAFAPSAPGTLYVSLRTTVRDAEPWNGGVYRSDDAGLTWKAANGEGLPNRVAKRGESSYMASNNKELAVDPRIADTLYAGNRDWVTAGVRKSTDGGKTWQRSSVHHGEGITMEYGWITQWGPSVECMALSPAKPDRVAFGTSGHLFVSDDAGKTWQQRYCQQLPDGRFAGTGLEVTCLNNVEPDPVRPGRAYFCYMDIGLLITEDGGKTFRNLNKGMKHAGNTFTVVVDPKAPKTLWAGTGEWGNNVGDVCRSDDDGATWKRVGTPETGLPNGQTRRLVLDLASPVASRRMVVTSNGNGVYETRDGGASWRCINGDLPADVAKAPQGLLMDPADGGHLVVALAGRPEKGGGVYETRDGGAHWARTHAEPLFWGIQSLAADPKSFGTLYVTTREQFDQAKRQLYPGGVYRSADGGKTWQQVLDYHFVTSLTVHPRDSRVLYAVTNDHPFHDDYVAEGVLKSSDGGATWRHENSGLSLWNGTCLAVSPLDPSLLYVGTGGNSVFVGRDAAFAR